ncbi:hypothetical protein P4O66_014411 [Electrophorus voltai]|uniref:Anaphylatoxin-like domain-containing protein n=1 Tax=Electrophorus voltai TaxID=2609070 RepID=A0AAD8Z190_9TELE|nr:hypothetical protein P4O66_014411 [Electrophorus voltai]
MLPLPMYPTPLPAGNASTPLCHARLVQKHCCEAAVQDGICAKGITAAKRPGACELSSFQGDLWEVKTAKLYVSTSALHVFFCTHTCRAPAGYLPLAQMCCECCELGMLMQKEARDCELPIALSTPCWATARACCQDGHRGPALPATPGKGARFFSA